MAADDAVFWADHQARGRGRQQRNWHDEPGLDLAVTFRLTAKLPRPVALPAALPVAILQACEPFAQQPLRFKWPNDVYARGQKLSGVLIDRDTNRPETYRIGIGINVNRTQFPTELQDSATSLRLLSGSHHDRGSLLLALAEQIDGVVKAIESDELTHLEHLFAERLELLGAEVEVEARERSRGQLTAINFDRLVLDGQYEVPLAIVRSLRRTHS